MIETIFTVLSLVTMGTIIFVLGLSVGERRGRVEGKRDGYRFGFTAGYALCESRFCSRLRRL